MADLIASLPSHDRRYLAAIAAKCGIPIEEMGKRALSEYLHLAKAASEALPKTPTSRAAVSVATLEGKTWA